jgi:hypothetical protein
LEATRACTVPWVVADIDGDTWEESDRLTRRLCRLLEDAGAPLKHVTAHTASMR